MSVSQGQISNEQLELLLDYLDDHHDLARGRLRSADGRIIAKRLWEEVTDKLNSIGGGIKTAQQWQKVWTDRKHLAKKSAAATSNPAAAAGGDPSCKVPLTQWEMRVLDILGESFAEAQTTACASAFPHKFDIKVEMTSDSTSHSQLHTLPQTSFQQIIYPQTPPTPSHNFLEDNHGPVALTIEQLDMLLDFMDEHRDFARGRLRNADGRVRAKNLWEELMNMLNTVGGSVKTLQQWQKVWTDRKHAAKKSVAAIKKTGGAPSDELPIAPWELRVLEIIGDVLVARQTVAPVSDLPQISDSEDDLSPDPLSPQHSQPTLPQPSPQSIRPSQNITEENPSQSHFQSTEQFEILLDFMEEHRDLACGRLRSTDGRAKAKRLWEEVTYLLNSVQGSHKTMQQWQKVWTDRKHVARKNAAAIRRSGGERPDDVPISPWEPRVLEIIGNRIGSQTSACDSALQQNFDFEEDSSDYLPQNQLPISPQADTALPQTSTEAPSENSQDFEESLQVTTEQLRTLLDFMDQHRDLACGRLRNADGRVKATKLWASITNKLNSLQGSVKTVQQWQKVWSDRKHMTRKSVAKKKLIGDVPTEWELRMINIVGTYNTSGEPLIKPLEPTFPQDFDIEEDSSDSLPQNQPPRSPETDPALPQTSTEAPSENSQDFEESVPVTTEQLRTLLNFMDQHRDLACGRLRNADGRVKATRLWAEITNKLNSLQGSVKVVQQWQKLWTDRKHMARKSVAKKNLLGGGPTEWELRIINIVGDTNGEPMIKPLEPAFPQDFDDEEELASDSPQHFEPPILPKQETTPVEVEFIPVQDTNATRKCRICLHDGSIYIFRETGPHDIPKYITALTGILIKRNDNLPKYICDECYESLETAILFRKTAQLTHLLLKRNKSRFPLKRFRPIPIRFQRNEVESKRVKVESDRNVLVKQEPTSEEDELENFDDNCANSDTHEDTNRVCVNITKEPEVAKSEQSECTKRNVSVKREVSSDDEKKTEVKDTFKFMCKEKEDRVNQNFKGIVNECKIANKSFNNRTYTEHVKIRKKIAEIIKKRKKIECKLCNKYLYNSECYIKHMKCFHKNEPDSETIKSFGDRIQCEICKKQIVYFKYHSHVKNVHFYKAQTLTKVNTEIKKPNQKFKRKRVPRKRQCPICKKSYTRRYYIIHLELHKMEENGEPAQCICEVCGRLFKLQTTLRAHQATHSNEFPFICTYCPYRGRTNELLKLHVQTHTGDYPYKCPHCPNRSTSSSNLRKHMRVHDSKFKLYCDTCKKGCHTKPDLERHVRAKHLGIKDHVCNICGMEFGYRKGMLSHQFKVHKRAKLKARAKPLYLRLEDEKLLENTQ